MKKNIILIVLLSFISFGSFAQAKDSTGVKVKDYPVNGTFESGYLIDAQTVVIPQVKTLEAVIQHKFGTIENGKTDLWGIYAPGSNIRIGVNYVVGKNVQIGAGITKKNMTTDLSLKWTLLQQTKKNSIPFSLMLYGNVGIDGRAGSTFDGTMVQEGYSGHVYHFRSSDRWSYFSQLVLARKFTDWLSLQAGASFTHYNCVATGYDHDMVGVHFNGRIKVSPQGSFLFNYNQALKIKNISEQTEWWADYPKPTLSFGYEISTGTHAFQIFAASTQGILPQDDMMWNQMDFNKSQYTIGFTITRLWAY